MGRPKEIEVTISCTYRAEGPDPQFWAELIANKFKKTVEDGRLEPLLTWEIDYRVIRSAEEYA